MKRVGSGELIHLDTPFHAQMDLKNKGVIRFYINKSYVSKSKSNEVGG